MLLSNDKIVNEIPETVKIVDNKAVIGDSFLTIYDLKAMEYQIVFSIEDKAIPQSCGMLPNGKVLFSTYYMNKDKTRVNEYFILEKN